MEEKTIAERWTALDNQRVTKLERARKCASLTIPSLMPPEGWTEEDQLPQPYSSVPARGVMNMASRILSAMLPLNDSPFFKFEMDNGMETTGEVYNYLETLAYQVHGKLSSQNLRETIYTALQHLIVVGDVLILMEDSMKFRIIRSDQYVIRRTVEGDVQEIIHVEHVPLDNEESIVHPIYTQGYQETKAGYRTHFIRIALKDDGETWGYERQDGDGNTLDSGEYTVNPYIPLRWCAVAGENYGRSHCEDIIGDIQSLESFTEGLLEGVAAGSAFWIAVNPAGITELDDVAGASNGTFISARQEDISTISPANTMNSQIQSTQAGVEILRREVGNAFLLSGSAIPKGERVTATAVRMIGSELETVLGGAFSAIARDLMEPLVRRSVFLMLENNEIDQRMSQQFSKDGILSVQVVTGLQALSRDTDLQKLMQMGEMVRNLPENAVQLFNWEEYARQLITAIGFDNNNWVKSEEQIQEQMMAQQRAQAEQQMMMQEKQLAGQAMANVAENVATEAGVQDIQQTGGAGIEQVLQNNPEALAKVQSMLGGGA